jgi:hypothetical protein
LQNNHRFLIKKGFADMKQSVYYQGLCGKKWGIWDVQQNQWRFDICEDTPMLATARLFQKIGPNARKERRYEPRQLPEKKVSQVSCGGGST